MNTQNLNYAKIQTEPILDFSTRLGHFVKKNIYNSLSLFGFWPFFLITNQTLIRAPKSKVVQISAFHCISQTIQLLVFIDADSAKRLGFVSLENIFTLISNKFLLKQMLIFFRFPPYYVILLMQ